MSGAYYCAMHGCDVSGPELLLVGGIVMGPIIIVGIILEILSSKDRRK